MSVTNPIGSAGGFEYIDHLGFGFPGLFGCATSTGRTAIPVILRHVCSNNETKELHAKNMAVKPAMLSLGSACHRTGFF